MQLKSNNCRQINGQITRITTTLGLSFNYHICSSKLLLSSSLWTCFIVQITLVVCIKRKLFTQRINITNNVFNCKESRPCLFTKKSTGFNIHMLLQERSFFLDSRKKANNNHRGHHQQGIINTHNYKAATWSVVYFCLFIFCFCVGIVCYSFNGNLVDITFWLFPL